MLAKALLSVAGGFALDFVYLGGNNSNSNLTTYTFSSVSFGDAHAARIVAVSIAGYHTGTSGTRTISSVTIGGVAATLVEGTSSKRAVGIAYASVPTGTSGDVVVTFSGGFQACRIARYRFNTSDHTHLDSLYNGTASNVSSINVSNVECAVGGVVIGVIATKSSTLSSSWNGTDSTVEDRNGETEDVQQLCVHVLTTEDSTIRDLTGTLSPAAYPDAACLSFNP